MKLFTFFILSVLATVQVIGIDSVAYAQQTVPAQPSTESAPQQVPLATVNIQDARIVSQDGRTLTIAFSISNREGVQAGVRYAVKLFMQKNQIQVDETVYEETLTLQANDRVEKQIVYVAPSALSGTYDVAIASSNENGFPLGFTIAGQATLASGGAGIEIVSSSCTVSVEGEPQSAKGSRFYYPMQGVDVDATEQLRLTCNAKNAGDAITVTPSFVTHYRSLYGAVVPTEGGDTTPIQYAAGEEKPFSVLLPMRAKPQAYVIAVGLNAGDTKSNTVQVRYVVRGMSATIQNVSLDRDYYASGEQATALVLWSPSADSFARARANNTNTITGAEITVSLKNDRGRTCANPVTYPLTAESVERNVQIALPVKADCFNPTVVAVFTDDKGTVLDRKTFSVETTSVPRSSGAAGPVALIAVIVIALVGAVVLYRKRHHNDDMNPPASSTIIKVMIPFIILLTTMLPTGRAHADTFYVGSSGGYAMVNINKSSYAPGETIYADGSIDMNNGLSFWDPGYASAIQAYNLTASTTGNSAQSYYNSSNVTFDICGWGMGVYSCSQQQLSWPSIYGTKAFTAPSTPGSYNMTFAGAWNAPDAFVSMSMYTNDFGGSTYTGYVVITNNSSGQQYSINSNNSYEQVNVPKGTYTINAATIFGCSLADWQITGVIVGSVFTLDNNNLQFNVPLYCYE